jgi:hypothetical protein
VPIVREAAKPHRLLDDTVRLGRVDRRRLGLHAQIGKGGETGHIFERFLRMARRIAADQQGADDADPDGFAGERPLPALPYSLDDLIAGHAAPPRRPNVAREQTRKRIATFRIGVERPGL